MWQELCVAVHNYPWAFYGPVTLFAVALYSYERYFREPRVIVRRVPVYETEPPPPETHRRVFDVACVDPEKVAAFQKDNPHFLTVGQWRSLLPSIFSSYDGWLNILNNLIAKALVNHPGTTPLFRIVAVRL